MGAVRAKSAEMRNKKGPDQSDIFLIDMQGDPLGCFLCFVDIKTKVALKSKLLILKRNFCFEVDNT